MTLKNQDFRENRRFHAQCRPLLQVRHRYRTAFAGTVVYTELLAKEAIKALKADKIRFYPSGKRDQLITYLEGLRDWNISRTLLKVQVT